MQDKLRFIPLIITLTASAVAFIITTLMGYGLRQRALLLLAVFLGFYIVCRLIEFMIRRFVQKNEEKAKAEGEVLELESDAVEEETSMEKAPY